MKSSLDLHRMARNILAPNLCAQLKFGPKYELKSASLKPIFPKESHFLSACVCKKNCKRPFNLDPNERNFSFLADEAKLAKNEAVIGIIKMPQKIRSTLSLQINRCVWTLSPSGCNMSALHYTHHRSISIKSPLSTFYSHLPTICILWFEVLSLALPVATTYSLWMLY